ncbi:uncharacterized protein LOC144750105 [Ciona intestinalis]
MRKHDFEQLVHLVLDDMKPSIFAVREPIDVNKRVAIGLYKLASSSEYRTIGELFGVSEASVRNCLLRYPQKMLYIFLFPTNKLTFVVVRLCDALCKHLKNHIFMPDKEEPLKIAARFEKKSHFPRVMGCIDGSHIAVTAPLQGKKDYTNRKGLGLFSSASCC